MRKRVLIFVVAMVMAIVALPSVASADGHRSSELVTRSGSDNPWRCEDGTKIEDPETGRYRVSFGSGSGYVDLTVYPDNTFDFRTDRSSHVVDSVLVKGGPNALLFHYDPAVYADEGLHAPMNQRNGKYYGLSHICLMTDKKSG